MHADIVFINGKIITVDKNDSIAEAVAISGKKIAAVGTTDEISGYICDDTKVIDLEGKCMIPGIIESHVHTAVHGANSLAIDCRSPGVGSIEDIKALIKEAAKDAPKGQWIRGWGYDHSKLKEGRHPNKWDLDEVAPDNPVMLTRVCAHISTHNSKSLELAGLDDSSTPSSGGEFERIDGKISGVMFENAHMDMMKVAIPSKEEIIEDMIAANALLVQEGITSVHDSGGYGKPQMDAIQEAIEINKFKLRLNAMIFSFVENIKFVNDYLDVGVHTRFGDDHFQLGPIKIMIDGSSSGPTAATREPYTSNPDSCGIMSMTQEVIDDIVCRAHAGGWQMTCHAVGDKAIVAFLDAVEKAQGKHPRDNHRHRIEHCAMMTEGLMERVKELGIVPIPQPVFLYEFGDGYLKNYGKDRTSKMFPCASFIKNDVIAAGSSDCPITFSNPFLNIYMAITRTTQTGQVVNEDECVSINEALRMFTYNGAYASFEEEIKGTIEKGKLADLVVLSDDIYSISKDAVKDLKADLTMIDGEIVFER